MDVIEVETPHGPARAHLEERDGAKGLVVLGHGAGGGVGAPDLVRAELEARKLGFATALVEQPYVVAGRKAPPPAAKADEAWGTVLAFLRERLGDPVPLITGGRSFGARVACRTAAETARPPCCVCVPRASAGQAREVAPDELDAVEVPVLVVQGQSDPFGMPAGGPGKEIVVVAGNHGLKKDLDAVGEAVARWLGQIQVG